MEDQNYFMFEIALIVVGSIASFDSRFYKLFTEQCPQC